MSGAELAEKVKRMSEYLDEEAISAALRIPAGTVRGILKGEVSIDSV
jgi:hypothetical protein